LLVMIPLGARPARPWKLWLIIRAREYDAHIIMCQEMRDDPIDMKMVVSRAWLLVLDRLRIVERGPT